MPDQPSLFDSSPARDPTPGPTLPRSHSRRRHRDGPHVFLPSRPTATQLAAASRAWPRSGSQREVVLSHFRSRWHHQGDGYTDEEMARATGYGLNSVRPRRKELAEDGWVADSGQTRPTATGAPATVWVYQPARDGEAA